MHPAPSLEHSRHLSAETSGLISVSSAAGVGSHDTHAIGETIASLAAGLHAATYQLLVLLREFDARCGWNNGFLSCAHWLHWRTGFDLGASREKVRVARALPTLPRIAWAMERGQLSYARVRALTRVATPENEAALLDVALAGDRYQVVVHVDAAAGTQIDPAPAVIELDHDAQHVSAETSRRLSCDAAIVRMTHSADGSVLDVGRQTRTIPPAIRRALAARDRSCRFPGCTSRRCDAHHIEHWSDGGATRLDNLVLLCRHHHRAVHEGGFRVAAGEGGTLTFWRPDGARIPQAAPAIDSVDLETLHSHATTVHMGRHAARRGVGDRRVVA